MTIRPLLAVTAVAISGLALAKLPPLDDAAKAKAAETAAKAAWQGKVDNFLLCKSQDRVVAAYRKGSGVAPVKGADVVKVKAAASAPAAAAVAAAASAPAAAASGTPVAAAPVLAPCADPGPFAYAPPEQPKPLEAAGAHSPASTAVSPPSSKTPAADMAPTKPGVASTTKKS